MKKAVWIDKKGAYFIPEDGSSIMQFDSMIESRERFAGETDQQGRFGGQYVAPEKKSLEREKHQLQNYFEDISEGMKGCDEVLIFGPADTKKALHNFMKADHRFKSAKFHVESADSMSENQMRAFVREYFSK